MTLIDSWMPTYDVAARYAIRINAPPAQVYTTLLATDFGGLWLVRALMGVRLLPSLFRSPRVVWRRLRRPSQKPHASLTDLSHSDFVLLEQSAPREIVLGITGRFWTLAAEIAPVPPERFREPLLPGIAQAAWNFEVTASPNGSELATETRIRCADPTTLRHFRWYWRIVAPGSALIRHAILRQVRREATGVPRWLSPTRRGG
jgi:hypothetical protein